MTGKIMPLRERDTSTVQAAADAFLSSPRYANPNTRRGYTGALDPRRVATDSDSSAVEGHAISALWSVGINLSAPSPAIRIWVICAVSRRAAWAGSGRCLAGGGTVGGSWANRSALPDSCGWSGGGLLAGLARRGQDADAVRGGELGEPDGIGRDRIRQP